MARSSQDDPIEKFRFSVNVITLDANVMGGLQTAAGALAGPNSFVKNSFAIVARAGFSEVTLPKSNVNEITYRENLDSQKFSKGPGLVKFDPVTLRRGVTTSLDLYQWYRDVNNDSFGGAVAQELTKDHLTPPPQSENFRKEVIIAVYNRAGNVVKQWILFNAFPISYKGGDDLNAKVEEKLVEEITLTYEYFLELEGDSVNKGPVGILTGSLKETAKDALEAKAIGAAKAIKSGTFGTVAL